MYARTDKARILVDLLFKLDRSFRRVSPINDDVIIWEAAGVSFISLRGLIDTSTPLGSLLLNLLESLAKFEPELIPETDGNRRHGVKIGRPRVTDRKGFKRRFGDILERLNDEKISRRQAAIELGIGYATLKRLLDSGYQSGGVE